MESATKSRDELDDQAVAEEQELQRQEGEREDWEQGGGIGPPENPNSEESTGIPGGAQPGDDGYTPPEPPTPPADLPDDGAPEDDDGPELFITADKQLGMKVGGRKPDSSVLKLKGCKIELDGQFNRADRLLAVTTLQVTGDHDDDSIVKQTGEVKSASKAQLATLCGIARLEEYLAARLPTNLLDPVFDALGLDVLADDKTGG